MAAWAAPPFLLWVIARIDRANHIVMPQNLAGTLLCVASIYGLGKYSDHEREKRQRASKPGLPRPTPPAPKPGEPPLPPPDSGQGPEDEPGDSADDDDKLELTAATCESLNEFSRADVAKAAPMTPDAAKHWIGVRVRRGWVEHTSYGRYRWKGRGPTA